jgi:hypothetical protein
MTGKLKFGYHNNKAFRIASGAKKREKRRSRHVAKLALRQD